MYMYYYTGTIMGIVQARSTELGHRVSNGVERSSNVQFTSTGLLQYV